PERFYATNPFVLVYAPYAWPGRFGLLEVAVFVAAAIAISAGLLAMAIARLRRGLFAAAGGGGPPNVSLTPPRLPPPPLRLGAIRRWHERLPGPSLDGNPVLWREWHRSRPSRLARILWVLYWLGMVIATAIGSYNVFAYGIDNVAGQFMIHTALVLQSVLGLM